MVSSFASLWTLRGLDGQVLRRYESHLSWGTYEDYVYRDGQLLGAALPRGSGAENKDVALPPRPPPQMVIALLRLAGLLGGGEGGLRWSMGAGQNVIVYWKYTLPPK